MSNHSLVETRFKRNSNKTSDVLFKAIHLITKSQIRFNWTHWLHKTSVFPLSLWGSFLQENCNDTRGSCDLKKKKHFTGCKIILFYLLDEKYPSTNLLWNLPGSRRLRAEQMNRTASVQGVWLSIKIHYMSHSDKSLPSNSFSKEKRMQISLTSVHREEKKRHGI